MRYPHYQPPPLTRRQMLKTCGCGFGGLALSSLLQRDLLAAEPGNPLAPRPPHFAPKAKRIIFLHMHGGPSQHDLFEYKPLLVRDDNKPLPFAKPRVQFNETGNLFKSPWEFKQHGQSGAWVSELMPNIASVVDDLCFIRSMWGTNAAHGGAILAMNTGSDRFVRPSMGSWIAYGLGTENENLPGFITICPSYQHGGVQNYSSAFLPAAYNGTAIGTTRMKTEDATIDFLDNESVSPEVQRSELDLLQRWQRRQLEQTGPDQALEGRIESFELAFRMQTEAPELMSIEGESEATRRLYGLDDPVARNFGLRCLLARRFSESGVRFVQATHGPDSKWDHHSGLITGLPQSCAEVDRPVAGLIKDLKSRGLLDETLVLWGGEFGRTPGAEAGARNGRDHNPHGYTMFMAGGGVKPGHSHGRTDDYGYYAIEDKVHIHDLHATILHLLGLDHERLTYRTEDTDPGARLPPDGRRGPGRRRHHRLSQEPARQDWVRRRPRRHPARSAGLWTHAALRAYRSVVRYSTRSISSSTVICLERSEGMIDTDCGTTLSTSARSYSVTTPPSVLTIRRSSVSETSMPTDTDSPFASSNVRSWAGRARRSAKSRRSDRESTRRGPSWPAWSRWSRVGIRAVLGAPRRQSHPPHGDSPAVPAFVAPKDLLLPGLPLAASPETM